jgi:hypothetical protein
MNSSCIEWLIHFSVRILGVKKQYFLEFLKQIEPFRELWRSVRFVGYAGKIGDTWVLLNGRIQLCEKAINSEVLDKVANFDSFFAFVDEFHSESLPQILQAIIENENIHINLGGPSFRDIRLSIENNQNTISWFGPNKFDRTSGNFFETEPVGVSWSICSQRQIATFPDAVLCLEKASEQLRKEKHIDGVEALARKLTPGLKLNSRVSPMLQVVAPLPFSFRSTGRGEVRLTVPVTAQRRLILLKAFFYPEPQSYAEKAIPAGQLIEEHPIDLEWKPDWPEKATHASVRLFWGEHDIDVLMINRWPASASLRGAVDEYFDSEHTRLRAALRWNDKKKSDEFELAVVRLLNILGIPAIWYGKTVDPDRADAACVIQSEQSTTLLLIECVREAPDEKFSSLAARARHLREELKIELEVVPAVFTPARTVESEIAAAVQHGISLIGSDEIEQLVALIALPDMTPDKVVQRLRPHETIADHILGIVGQL